MYMIRHLLYANFAILFLNRFFTFASFEQSLHDKLFKEYNKNVRPVHHRNSTVEVIIHMFESGFMPDGVDLLKGTISGTLWFSFTWKDQFLTWNSSKCDDVVTIAVHSKDIWLPEIVLLSEKGHVYFVNPDTLGRVLISADGTVSVWYFLNMDLGFNVSVYKYPFDSHETFFEIFSWLYGRDLVHVRFSESSRNVITQKPQNANGQWLITYVKAENLTKGEGAYAADILRFHFLVERKWMYYVLNILTPVAITSALNILCFTLPSDSGERITLCISIYLTLAVFLSVVNSALPETSDEQSILSIYIGLQFLASTCTITIIMTVISLQLYHKDGEINWSVRRVLASIRCKRNREHDIAEDDNSKKRVIKSMNDRSWKSASEWLNQVCFYLSIAWIIGLIIAFAWVVRS